MNLIFKSKEYYFMLFNSCSLSRLSASSIAIFSWTAFNLTANFWQLAHRINLVDCNASRRCSSFTICVKNVIVVQRIARLFTWICSLTFSDNSSHFLSRLNPADLIISFSNFCRWFWMEEQSWCQFSGRNWNFAVFIQKLSDQMNSGRRFLIVLLHLWK